MSGFLGGLRTRPKAGIVKGMTDAAQVHPRTQEAGKAWGVSFLIETKDT